VLTTASNTYTAGDFVEYSCAWARANARLFRVKAATSTTVTLEGFDTTSTTLFPTGGGVGSVRKVTTWVPIPYVQSADPAGGDPKFTQTEFIDYPDEISLPNGFSAMTLNMTIADNASAPHHAVMMAASDSGGLVAIKAALPAGGVILYSGILGFNPSPSMSKGQAMVVKAGLALQGRQVRYAT